jgi:biotin operon repressor
MRINVTEFVKEYNDAVAANLSTKELADLIGIRQTSLWHRVDQCRKHGISLPPLRGGFRLSPETRTRRRANRRRTVYRKQRQPAAARTVTTAADIDLLSDRVADKVFNRLRDTLRFQFFVGPEIPA